MEEYKLKAFLDQVLVDSIDIGNNVSRPGFVCCTYPYPGELSESEREIVAYDETRTHPFQTELAQDNQAVYTCFMEMLLHLRKYWLSGYLEECQGTDDALASMQADLAAVVSLTQEMVKKIQTCREFESDSKRVLASMEKIHAAELQKKYAAERSELDHRLAIAMKKRFIKLQQIFTEGPVESLARVASEIPSDVTPDPGLDQVLALFDKVTGVPA